MSSNSNNISNTFKVSEPYTKIPSILELDGIILKHYPYENTYNSTKEGIVYSETGKLVYRGETGTFTVLATE